MGVASLEHRYLTVHKVYPAKEQARADREIQAYHALPWATPQLECFGAGWLDIERCTPILDLAYDQTRKYRDPLRTLVQDIHEAGWWHCDLSLTNVVIHPVRGPLLIDWEGASPASSPVSNDLYGARAAGMEKYVWKEHRPDGVWWGGPWPECPGRFWGDPVVRLD